MAQIPPTGEWRFASLEYGAQCVPISGMTVMPESCVNNSDTPLKVVHVIVYSYHCY